jgi:outer membrane protein OmpA-like peptidoglycan-associated protein
MRTFSSTLIFSCVLLALQSPARADQPTQTPIRLEKDEPNLPPLKLDVDRSKVDLEGHRLEVTMSREAKSVRIKVLGESGATIAEQEHDFSGAPAGKALVVTWNPSSDEKVARIEVYGYDVHGYYAGVAITPWSVSIPHQEVNFETDSAVIGESEKAKLEASYEQVKSALTKYKDIGSISLFIAGHTDTVGSAEHNLELSRRRARSIAAWFRKRGLVIPIFFEGFGEGVLAVKTKDEVDEPRNRRADYILSIEAPRFKSSGSTPAWKKI